MTVSGQIVRVFGQRGRDGDAAAQWAQGEGDEADRHPPGGSQLGSSTGPAPGGHEPHAGLHTQFKSASIKNLEDKLAP